MKNAEKEYHERLIGGCDDGLQQSHARLPDDRRTVV